MVNEAKTRILESNLLSERFRNGRWVALNRMLLLSQVLSKLNIEVSVILDLGCGDGKYSTLLLKDIANIRRLIGVDVSKELIRKAKTNSLRGNIEFLVADGQNLPFENRCFDLILSKDLLHHVRHPFEVLREISRVSKGEVVVVEANKYNALMLLNEKYGNHQHLTVQQLELLGRHLQVGFFSVEQVHAYPFSLRVQSFHPIACIWNALASIFLIGCNKVPYLAELAFRGLSFLLLPSFNILSTQKR